MHEHRNNIAITSATNGVLIILPPPFVSGSLGAIGLVLLLPKCNFGHL